VVEPQTAAGVVDGLLDRPTLVVGSLPPKGRDLDLFTHADQATALADGLRSAGFVCRDELWVRFRDCGADVVDVIPIGTWGLGESAASEMLAEAMPIDGFQQLVRPAPHHALLVAAGQVARAGRLGDGPRRRVDAAAAEDADALTCARPVAARWALEDELAALERHLRANGAPVAERRVARLLRGRTRLGGGVLVTLSGLDGSGKSTQAAALASSLDALGHPVEVVWTNLGAARLLAAVAAPARAVLRAAGRGPAAPRPAHDQGASAPTGDPATALRRRSRALGAAWTTVVAATNAVGQMRATWPHLAQGRVVVCDRWTLDSLVHLRYAYGDGQRYALARMVLRSVMPRPRRAYLLGVAPEVACQRKPEYTLEQARVRARLYDEEAAELGVIRLDGALAQTELCAGIADDVSRSLAE